jgi:hypothetical protein
LRELRGLGRTRDLNRNGPDHETLKVEKLPGEFLAVATFFGSTLLQSYSRQDGCRALVCRYARGHYANQDGLNDQMVLVWGRGNLARPNKSFGILKRSSKTNHE